MYVNISVEWLCTFWFHEWETKLRLKQTSVFPSRRKKKDYVHHQKNTSSTVTFTQSVKGYTCLITVQNPSNENPKVTAVTHHLPAYKLAQRATFLTVNSSYIFPSMWRQSSSLPPIYSQSYSDNFESHEPHRKPGTTAAGSVLDYVDYVEP